MPAEPLPLTMTMQQFQRFSGLGKTKIYAMMKSGELRYAPIGDRRMIVVQSYVELLGEAIVRDRLRSLGAAE